VSSTLITAIEQSVAVRILVSGRHEERDGIALRDQDWVGGGTSDTDVTSRHWCLE